MANQGFVLSNLSVLYIANSLSLPISALNYSLWSFNCLQTQIFLIFAPVCSMDGDVAASSAAAAADAVLVVDEDRLGFGKMGYGCEHYKRRCMIRAPCCNDIFFCRHCHNESTSDKHELPRHDVQRVVCLVCDTEQQTAQVCSNCGVNMGEYYCDICKFYDDDIGKGQYHCNDCGICRVGGKENYFHCQKCGSCYSIGLLDKHSCVENSMRHHCPICFEYLFDSMRETRVLKCGHTLHFDCLNEMVKHKQYTCPICSKSMLDMSLVWRKLDEEVEATLMPEDYRDKKVWILCNDCNDTTEVLFHILGHKCSHCQSYNTRTISPPVLPQ